MKTAENVLESGLYTSTCCNRDELFSKDDVFRRCPHCNGLCEWERAETVAA